MRYETQPTPARLVRTASLSMLTFTLAACGGGGCGVAKRRFDIDLEALLFVE